MSGYKGRTDYTIREWRNLGELAVLLNTLVNEGWRADSHKLSAGNDNSGWTIFCRYVELDRPLLEREINVGKLYRILNQVLEPGSDKAREFDLEIKKAVRLPGDEETKEGAEERRRLWPNNIGICGCREYPEYGDACLFRPNHDGPHDWQKK